jgi:hypothetical protein
VTLNLHGVVRAGHPLTTGGFRLVVWQNLAMVVSDTGEDAPNERDALAHLEMLSRLVADGPVVPLRYGTTAADENAVRTEVLAKTARTLHGNLDRLNGVVEVHAYLRFDESAALRAVFEENQDDWRTGDDLDLSARIRLGEQVADRLVAWRRARAEVLLAPVSATAHAQVSLTEREHTEERHAFLVLYKDVDTVRAAVAELSNSGAVDAECVGPLPAYSFLAESTDTATNADRTPASRWGW